MSLKKMKRLFILCLIILLILIFVPNLIRNKKREEEKENNSNQITETNIGEVQNFDDMDYNNLSKEEMKYLSDKYMGAAKFTRKRC